MVIAAARLQHAATAGAWSAETLPFERLDQRSFRQLGADLDVLAVREPAAAPGAVLGLGPGDGGEDDVLAGETPDAPVSPFARLLAPQAGLVNGGEVVLGGDEPDVLVSVAVYRSRPRCSRVFGCAGCAIVGVSTVPLLSVGRASGSGNSCGAISLSDLYPTSVLYTLYTRYTHIIYCRCTHN